MHVLILATLQQSHFFSVLLAPKQFIHCILLDKTNLSLFVVARCVILLKILGYACVC